MNLVARAYGIIALFTSTSGETTILYRLPSFPKTLPNRPPAKSLSGSLGKKSEITKVLIRSFVGVPISFVTSSQDWGPCGISLSYQRIFDPASWVLAALVMASYLPPVILAVLYETCPASFTALAYKL